MEKLIISQRLRFFVFLLIFMFCKGVVAKPSIEDYGLLPSASLMSISPSGDLIAYKKHKTEADEIVVISLTEGKMLSRVRLGEVNPTQLYFVDNKRLIIKGYQHRKVDGFIGKFDLSTAFVMDVNSGKLRQILTPGKGVYKGQADLGDIVGLSPDGKYAFMPAFVGKNEADQNPEYSLVRANLTSRLSPKVVERGKPYTTDYFVNKKGKVLAEVRYNNKKNLHQVLARKGKELVEIYRKETDIPVISVVGLAQDQKSLVVLGQSNSGRVAYFSMSLKDGSFDGPLFGRKDADIEYALRDVNRVVYGVQYTGFEPSYQFFDDKVTKRVDAVVAMFAGESVTLIDWSPDWKNIIVYVEGSSTSGAYYLASEGKQLKFLTGTRPHIRTEDIHLVIAHKYKARDGLIIPTLVTIPQKHAKTMANMPTIMLPHGGPESYDKKGFDWLAQALASQGYMVIQPQFRGSDGFGADHILAGRGEWGKKMQDDLVDGLQALVKEGLVDPERVCILGASYGGYAALAGGAFDSEHYQCVVSINGISDIPRFFREEKSDHGKDHWVLSYWKSAITDGEKEQQTSISPARFADNFKAPVLLVHGDKDEVVSIDQSKHMHKKLKAAKKDVEFVKLKGEDHHLSTTETRVEALEAVISFVNKHIGG